MSFLICIWEVLLQGLIWMVFPQAAFKCAPGIAASGRMNRTLKEATVNRYDYTAHAQLKTHLHSFLMAYNLARRLKTLKGLTPYEYIARIWTQEPERFTVNPFQHTVGLNK